MANYRKRSGIQLAYPFEEKRLAKWTPPYIIQPKLDGERCRSVPLEDGGHLLLSSEENVVHSVPHINEQLNTLAGMLGGQLPAELDGELYVHGWPFEAIHSVVGRTVNIHPDHRQMDYHLFDIVDEKRSQVERLNYLKMLSEAFNQLPNIYFVRSVIVANLEEVLYYFDEFRKDGYEGIIVRHCDAPYKRARSTWMMKFKPKKSDIYQIVGWKEEITINGEPKGRLGALICVGDDGTEFSVGTGFTDEMRNFLWSVKEILPGRQVRIAYQHITSGKGVPRFPVFVEVLTT